MKNWLLLCINFIYLFNKVYGQSKFVDNVGPRFVNGIPDQIALEQGQKQQSQYFGQSVNPQQNFIVDGNNVQSYLQHQLAAAPGFSGFGSLVYPQSQQQQQIQQQPQHHQQTQIIQNTPAGNPYFQFQNNQETQFVQNQVPVYQQQDLQYFQTAPQIQYDIQVPFSSIGEPLTHYGYGALNFQPGNPFVSVGQPLAFPSPVFHAKPAVIQHQAPIALAPVIAVKEIVKVPVPVPVKVQPICTVYPFQKNIPGCVLEKALFPGKYHPDVISLSTSKTSFDKISNSTETPETTTTLTTPKIEKPEAKIAPAKKDPTKKNNKVNDSFVVLNNADEGSEMKTSTESSLSFNDEDEALFQELEREMQNGKTQN